MYGTGVWEERCGLVDRGHYFTWMLFLEEWGVPPYLGAIEDTSMDINER